MSTTPQYTIQPEFANNTIIVTNTQELTAAISSFSGGNGGTILVDGSAGPYQIDAHGLGSNGASVLIKPLDPADPPHVEQVDIYNSSHLTVTGMDIDSAAIADTRHVSITDVNIYDSNDIQFVGNMMDSTADAMWTQSNPPAETAVTIRNCQNVDILDNTITDYKNGIIYLEVTGMNISGNDISGLQGDSLKGGGIQDVVISNNHIHDFYGATQDVNHSDMIQIFGTGRSIVTNNVEIYGNVLDNGDGAATQGIFIRNENFSGNGSYQNISIHDNVIYTAMPQGIGVNDTLGLDISDNTVLWSENATYLRTEGDVPLTAAPRIIVTNSYGATVDGNLVGDSTVNSTKLAGNNYIVDYSNPASAAYIENHVVNFNGSGQSNLTDLQLDPNSAIYDQFGAPMSSGGAVPTPTPTPSPSPAPTPVPPVTPPPSTDDETGAQTGGGTTDQDTGSNTGSDGAGNTSPTPTPAPGTNEDDTSAGTGPATETVSAPTAAVTQTAAPSAGTAATPDATQDDPAANDDEADASAGQSGNFLASLFDAISNLFRGLFGGGKGASANDNDADISNPVARGSRADDSDDNSALAHIPMVPAEEVPDEADDDAEDDWLFAA